MDKIKRRTYMSQTEIMIQFARLWGQLEASVATNESRQIAEKLKEFNSEEMMEVLSEWTTDYLWGGTEDTVAFFYEELRKYLHMDFIPPAQTCVKIEKTAQKGLTRRYMVAYFYYIIGHTFGFDNFFLTEKPEEDIFTKENLIRIQENLLRVHPTYTAVKIMNIIPLHDEISY